MSKLPLAIYTRLSKVRKPRKKDGKKHKKDKKWKTVTVRRQERICREWAAANKVKLWPEVFVDNNLSAWLPDRKRPAWDRINELLRSGQIGGVLVFDADRFCRKNFDLEVFLLIAERFEGMRLASPTGVYDLDSPDAQDMLRMRVQMANREVVQNRKRVLAVLEERARSGLPPGRGRSYGWKNCNSSKQIPEEAAVIQEATRRILAGEPVGTIVTEFEKRGIRTVGGNPWTTGSLQRTLIRPRNAGIVLWQGEPVARTKGKAIITEEEWRALTAFFNSRRRGAPPKGAFPCTGRVWCGRCGHRMGGERLSAQGIRVYRCKYRKDNYMQRGCYLMIEADALEADVRDGLIGWLSDSERARQVAQLTAVADEQTTAAVNALTTARRTLDDLYQKRAVGDLPDEECDRLAGPVIKIINARQKELDAIQAPARLKAVTEAEARRRWDQADGLTRRELIHTAYKTITVDVHPTKPGRRFTPDRVTYEYN